MIVTRATPEPTELFQRFPRCYSTAERRCSSASPAEPLSVDAVEGEDGRPAESALSEAQLGHHPQIVANGVVIDEPSVPNLVPVDVLNFKAVARRLDTDQLSAVYR